MRTSGDIRFESTSPNYKNLESFRSKYPDALTDAVVDFGEPPVVQRKKIMRGLTSPQSRWRRRQCVPDSVESLGGK